MSDYSFSFSGSDCHTFVSFMSPTFYGDSAVAAKVKLDCINTISISVHEQRTPVRRLGHSGVVGFAGSVRTVAGSIIITIVKDNPFYELIEKSNLRNYWTGRIQANDTGNEAYKDIKHPYNYNNPKDSFEYMRTNNSPVSKFNIQNLTTLPAMKFRMEFVSEYYKAKNQPYRSYQLNEERPLLRVMELHNVFIISENIVTSVNNMVTELVLQYVASDYVEFGEELTNQRIENNIKSQVAIPSTVKETTPTEQQNNSNPIVATPTINAIPVSVNSTTGKSAQKETTTATVTALPASTDTAAAEAVPVESPKAEPPKEVKTGSITVPVTSPINDFLSFSDTDKDYIKKIKDKKFVLDKELTTNISEFKKKNKNFNLNVIDQYQKETTFDFDSWYKTQGYNSTVSNSDDPTKQPDLTKENPLFAISAITEDQNKNVFRNYGKEESSDRYLYQDTTSMLSTSKENSISNKAYLISKFKELIGTTALEYELLESKFKEAKDDLRPHSSFNEYSNPEELIIKTNSNLMFQDRDIQSHKNFYNELSENQSTLIPEGLLPLYTQNAKAYIYESIKNEYNKTNSKETSKIINKHIDLYIHFLEKTGQLKEGTATSQVRQILELKKSIERGLNP